MQGTLPKKKLGNKFSCQPKCFIFKVTIQLQKKRIDAVGVKCVKGDAGDLASTTVD